MSKNSRVVELNELLNLKLNCSYFILRGEIDQK